jgi:hypothetical protein
MPRGRPKKVFVSINSLDEDAKRQIMDAIRKLDDSLTVLDAQKDNMKLVLDEVEATHQVSKKLVRKLAVVYHKLSFDEEQQFMNSFEDMWVNIVEPNK